MKPNEIYFEYAPACGAKTNDPQIHLWFGDSFRLTLGRMPDLTEMIERLQTIRTELLEDYDIPEEDT